MNRGFLIYDVLWGRCSRQCKHSAATLTGSPVRIY